MDNPHTVLVVEDEQHIADLLETNLSLDGFQVIMTKYGKDAIEIVQNRQVDIVLLDVMLPDGSGIDVCRTLKHKRQEIPILMISALGQSSDRIKGLKSGADDYLPKPFDLEELSLRMSNLLERSNKSVATKSAYSIGNATIDLDKQTITSNGIDDKMSIKETLLLKYMIEKRGHNLSRQNILEEVWGFEQFPNSRTIDNFISNFRKHIEEDPNHPKHIVTIRGIGYRLESK